MSTDARLRAAEREGDPERLALECGRAGHRWTTWQWGRAGTRAARGSRHRTCSRCDLEQIQRSRKEGGDWIDAEEWHAMQRERRRTGFLLPVPRAVTRG